MAGENTYLMKSKSFHQLEIIVICFTQKNILLTDRQFDWNVNSVSSNLM